MARSDYFDDEVGFDADDSPSRFFAVQWPVNEFLLDTAIKSGRSLEDIADEFDVSVVDVIDLCEAYGLDIG